jgi:integrase
MGSVRRDPRGKGWQARYRDRSGRQRTKTWSSKGEARRFLVALEAKEAGCGVARRTVSTDLRTYATTWRRSLVDLRSGTLINIDSRLHRYILPALGDRPLADMRPADVRDFLAALAAAGLSPTYTTGIYRVFARILASAEIDGVIGRNPCQDIRPPRQISGLQQHILSPSELARLANTIDGRYRALLYTAGYTGMRWGELAALKVPHLDLESNTITVVEALTETNGHVEVGPTRTGRIRAVSIPILLSKLLEDHLERYPSNGSHTFSSARGDLLRRNFYRRHFKPAVLRAGLVPDLRFHDLRHSAAAILAELGAHPKQIQQRFGHSSIQVTLDRYAYLLPSLDAQAAGHLEAAWRTALGADSQFSTPAQGAPAGLEPRPDDRVKRPA